jgi:hypothetical protein
MPAEHYWTLLGFKTLCNLGLAAGFYIYSTSGIISNYAKYYWGCTVFVTVSLTSAWKLALHRCQTA